MKIPEKLFVTSGELIFTSKMQLVAEMKQEFIELSKEIVRRYNAHEELALNLKAIAATSEGVYDKKPDS